MPLSPPTADTPAAVPVPPVETPAAPTVSVLVVSYNTREMTLACLASLAAETRLPHEVIVVDNASTDGSAEAIAAAFPDLTLLLPGRNLGFAAATNRAAEAARGDYLLLLNPDTVVLDRAVDRLVEVARAHPEAGIWGGRTVFADGSLNPTSVLAHTTLFSLFAIAVGLARAFPDSARLNAENYGGWPRDTLRPVDIVTGCFLLIPRPLWQRLGGFDERFTMYGEETDLCLRASALGAAPLFAPGPTIIHHGGASEPVRADKMVRLIAAKITLMQKHWSPSRVWAGQRLYLLMALLRRIGPPSPRTRAWAEIWRRRAEWLHGFPPR